MGIGFLSVVGVDSSCISLWARRHGYHFILFKNGYYEMCILFYASRDEETMKKKRRETGKRGKGEDMVTSLCWWRVYGVRYVGRSDPCGRMELRTVF